MPFNDNLPAENTDPWYAGLASAWTALKAFVNGLETAIGLKADSAAMTTALNGKASTTALTDGLATKASTTALTDGLALKADTTALTAGLAGKVDTATYTSGLAAKADLVGGVIPTSQIPAVAITEFLGEVATQAAMLALVGQKGDWAIRTDVGAYAILTAEPASTLGNWVLLELGGGGGGAVSSVNGETGIVVLSAADVGARPDTYVPAWADITSKPATFAPTIGATGSTAVAGNDARLTDQRVPTDGSVTSAKIANDSIVDADINSGAAIAQSKISGLAAALAAKAPLASPTFTGTVAGVTKAMVGLGSVDNTSDLAKPISTATSDALSEKVDVDARGAASGVASLDASAHMVYAELPPGSTISVIYDGAWDSRPTARTDIIVQWIDYTGAAGVPSGGLEGIDIVIQDSGA